MKKMLFVVTLLMVSSLFAGAKNYNFTFDGYCDGMELILQSGANQGIGGPAVFLSGTHDFSACGLSNSFVGGFVHSLSKQIPPFASPVGDVGDPFLGSAYGIPYNLEYVVTKPPCNWALFESVGSYNFYINGGTCTNFAGAKVQPGRGGVPSTKNAAAAHKR